MRDSKLWKQRDEEEFEEIWGIWGKLDVHWQQLITTVLCPVFKIILQVICFLPKEAWEKSNENY